MNTPKAVIKNGATTFELHPYKAGQSVEIFKGATGVFGKAAGSKTAGVVIVTKQSGTVNAEDRDVDSDGLWKWIQEWMQKGFDTVELPRLHREKVKTISDLNELVGLVIEAHKFSVEEGKLTPELNDAITNLEAFKK